MTFKGMAVLAAGVFLLGGCDEKPGEATGGGGDGGSSTTTTGGMGGTGGDAGGGSVGATGGGGPVDPDGDQLVNGMPATLETVLTSDCVIRAPMVDEDGSYARVVFGPFWEPWKSRGLRFLAARGDDYMIPKSWPIAWVPVPPGGDPMAVSCKPTSSLLDVQQLDSVFVGTTEIVLLESANFAPTDYAPGQTIVACLQLDSDVLGFGKPTGLVMCGAPDSCERADQWESSDAVETLESHGGECRHWMAQFIASECDSCYVGDECQEPSYATCGAAGMYCQACPTPGPCRVGACVEGACVASDAPDGTPCGGGLSCLNGACQ